MPSTLNKPETVEVYKFLRKHNAMIVHFSGCPKGAGTNRGSSHLFPTDLQHVADGNAMGGISCSVVRPGDVFYGFERNATGSIGIVVGLKSSDSLVAVGPSDCGSIENDNGIRLVQNECDITISDLENTLDERTAYNEWIVRDYTVLGVFASLPGEVSVLKEPVYLDDMPEYLRDNQPIADLRCVSLTELQQTFEGQTIYTFGDACIFRCEGNKFEEGDHSAIY